MEPIQIIKRREPEREGVWEYIVQIGPEGDYIGFLVRLEPWYYEKLTAGRRPPEELLKRTLEFLLRKEGLQNLPREFSCSEVGKRYPEYEEAVGRKMKRFRFFQL